MPYRGLALLCHEYNSGLPLQGGVGLALIELDFVPDLACLLAIIATDDTLVEPKNLVEDVVGLLLPLGSPCPCVLFSEYLGCKVRLPEYIDAVLDKLPADGSYLVIPCTTNVPVPSN